MGVLQKNDQADAAVLNSHAKMELPPVFDYFDNTAFLLRIIRSFESIAWSSILIMDDYLKSFIFLKFQNVIHLSPAFCRLNASHPVQDIFHLTVLTYRLQSCMADFRMVSPFFIAFFSD